MLYFNVFLYLNQVTSQPYNQLTPPHYTLHAIRYLTYLTFSGHVEW